MVPSICIRDVAKSGSWPRTRRSCSIGGLTRRGPSSMSLRRSAAHADSAREQYRERMGRAASRVARARGDRGRSELRADVWVAVAEGEDGPAGRGRAGDRVPAWDLPRGAPRLRRGADAAADDARASAAGAGAERPDQSAARGAAPGGPAPARRDRRSGCSSGSIS